MPLSKGYVRCVVLGGKVKIITCSFAASCTAHGEKWDECPSSNKRMGLDEGT